MQLIAEVGDELLDVLFLYELEPLNLQVQGPDGGPPDPLMHREELVLLVSIQRESFVKTPYYRLENKNLEGVGEDRIVKNTF